MPTHTEWKRGKKKAGVHQGGNLYSVILTKFNKSHGILQQEDFFFFNFTVTLFYLNDIFI